MFILPILNFIPITMDKNAIFINFLHPNFMDNIKVHFGIDKFIGEYNEFKILQGILLK